MRNSLDLWRSTHPWSVLNDVDRVFNGFLRTANADEERAFPILGFNPACEIDEKDDHFLISLDLPGVKQKEIKVETVDNRLVISGERRRETKEGRATERSYGRFERSFALPTNVDSNNIEARFEDGVLELAIPKAENAKPKTIEIQNGKGSFFGKFLNKADKKIVS